MNSLSNHLTIETIELAQLASRSSVSVNLETSVVRRRRRTYWAGCDGV